MIPSVSLSGLDVNISCGFTFKIAFKLVLQYLDDNIINLKGIYNWVELWQICSFKEASAYFQEERILEDWLVSPGC